MADATKIVLPEIERRRALGAQSKGSDVWWRDAPPQPATQPWRSLEVVAAPPRPPRAVETIAEARVLIPAAMREYLAVRNPEYMLLIRSLPGTGKTTAAAEVAEELAAKGRRVAYAGPRHDFFAQVLEKADHPGWWYEWLPRQAYDEGKNKPETCRYPAQIDTWMGKGYEGIAFCKRVCGWDYINDTCPYHRQKTRREPIIYIQHQHVTLGHPLDFSVLIGDESPVGAFLREWAIPGRFILPPGMDVGDPVTEILHEMTNLAGQVEHIEGEALLAELGGAERVLAACEGFTLALGVQALAPEIYNANQAESAPYFHLGETLELLAREAQACLEQRGKPYNHRIYLHNGELRLLLRRGMASEIEHVIWLDATGEQRIYEELFGRRVRVVDVSPHIHGRIYQVVDRANGKGSVIDGKTRMVTPKGGQLEAQIKRIIERHDYRDPVVISYQQFVEQADLGGAQRAHFYAARGTNAYEACDAVIVAGLPQPNLVELARAAKMIFWRRTDAFRFWEFGARPVTYDYIDADGLGRQYPVSNFWTDPDLMAVLKMYREDEILQAAHRGRPVNRAVDIWLLLNAPITGLPPDELLTIRELMDAPEGVEPFLWSKKIQPLLDGREISIDDLIALGLHKDTAYKYLKTIADLPGAEIVKVKTPGRGRPRLIVKYFTEIFPVDVNNTI